MQAKRFLNSRHNLTLRLLKAYEYDSPATEKLQLSDSTVERLYARGIQFLVLHATHIGSASVSEEMENLLVAADLTARVVYGQMCSSLEEVLTIAEERSIPVVLLKGIANAESLYRQPHHRIMGDIDILVPSEHAETIYRQLEAIDYEPSYPDRRMILEQGHHHLNPLRHPGSRIPVEIHTSLFSRVDSAFGSIFEPARHWVSTEEMSFRGKPCFKLNSELDLLHAVAHWSVDPLRTSNATGICDIVRMLQVRGEFLDLTRIHRWLKESPFLSDNLAVILDLLVRTNTASVPSPVLDNMTVSLDRIGTVNLRVLQFLLSTFSLQGRNRVAGLMTRGPAHEVWDTLLEPGNRSGRLPAAVWRALNMGRQPGELFFPYLLKRIKRSLRSGH